MSLSNTKSNDNSTVDYDLHNVMYVVVLNDLSLECLGDQVPALQSVFIVCCVLSLYIVYCTSIYSIASSVNTVECTSAHYRIVQYKHVHDLLTFN